MSTPNENKDTWTGGVKFDSDKPPMDLLDADALEELARVLEFGRKKYAAHNWRKGIALTRLVAAALRHLLRLASGERNDPETGLSHAAHAMCCCMFMLWTIKNRPDLDDLWKPDNIETKYVAHVVTNPGGLVQCSVCGLGPCQLKSTLNINKETK